MHVHLRGSAQDLAGKQSSKEAVVGLGGIASVLSGGLVQGRECILPASHRQYQHVCLTVGKMLEADFKYLCSIHAL
jgi:hypothetical protein